MRRLILAALVPLAACNPPATDEYESRGLPEPTRTGPSVPIASPDTTNSVWAPTAGTAETPERLVFGDPGTPPLLSIACVDTGAHHVIRFTRFAQADRDAKALLAVIGNGHIGRFKVDAIPAGKRRVWQGDVAIDHPRLGAFDGPRQIEATVPGGGSVMLHASPLPIRLIDECRRLESEREAFNAAMEPPELSLPATTE